MKNHNCQILFIDEMPLFNQSLQALFQKKGYDVVLVEQEKDALSLLRTQQYSWVIIGRGSTSFPFHALCCLAKELQSHAHLAIIDHPDSHYESCHIQALGAKAVFYRPFSLSSIEETIERIEQASTSTEVVASLPLPLISDQLPTELIAISPSMQSVVKDLIAVASSKAHVFLSGESGSGKEIVARTLHLLSNRKEQPFVKINCAAIPESLIEAEFFGFERGAFTGATQRRIGHLETAHQGTLLLDEITESPPSFQAKLLRAVQEQQFERIGGSNSLSVDVRFISTSNRNLQEAVEKKVLREDLFYRLNVIPIHLPPLRQRKEDILPLAEQILRKICQDNHKKTKTLSPDAIHILLSYTWPGNVRELQHLLEHTVLLHDQEIIRGDDLRLQSSLRRSHSLSQTLAELEERAILETLGQLKNNRTAAAKKLGISIRTLRNKLKSYEYRKL